MTTELLFEYPCPECGRGTVKTRVCTAKTKIRGYPFVVDDALIGVCDQCQADSFAPEETRRWEELFSRSLEARQAFLSPEEIGELRKIPRFIHGGLRTVDREHSAVNLHVGESESHCSSYTNG